MRQVPTPLRDHAGLAWLLATCALGLGASGCADASAQSVVEVQAADLACADSAPEADGSWQTAPLPPLAAGCTWLRFEGTTTYVVDHPLGHAPRDVEIFLSFDESDAPASMAAGNEALIQAVDDATLTLRNASHQTYFARVIVR